MKTLRHPIAILSSELSKHAEGRLKDGDYSLDNKYRIIAKHIQPLLDTVEELHVYAYDHKPGTAPTKRCRHCNVLRIWRAKP